MVSESVLCPVNMMMGALKPFLRRMRTASRPSTSGSPTSMITRSICPALAACTPLVPLSIAVDNGTKGVQAAKAGQIDLVIMDVGLPDVDGREAVRILRKNGFKAPIIMLTGHNTDSDTILGL